MGAIVANASQPALAAIKLAWWRERLEELDAGQVPAEPRLQAVAAELLPRGITGADVARLEEGWAMLLEEEASFEQSATARGPLLFNLAARLIGFEGDYDLSSAATEFALVDLARRGIARTAPQRSEVVNRRVPRQLRPVTALWALARRDQRLGGPPFEPEATPARAWTLLRHRWTGRV